MSWRTAGFFAASLGAGLLAFALFLLAEYLWPTLANTAFFLTRGLGTGLAVGLVATLLFQRDARHAIEESKQWLRFLDGLPVAAFALDAKGAPAFANRPAQALLGKGIVPNAAPSELSTVYPSFVAGTNDPYPADRMPIVRALKGEEGVRQEDIELLVDGERVPIDVWASSIRSASGEVEYAIAVFFDMRERQEAERQRIELAKREHELESVKRLASARTQLINEAAHELNTPLTPLMFDLPAIQASVPEDVAQRVSNAVNQLRDVSARLLANVQTATIQEESGQTSDL